MFAPICPLCCGHFSECTEISACRCGHTFHHNCVEMFRDTTKRFKGFRGCPACGGLKKRCGGKRAVGKDEREEASVISESKSNPRKRHRHRHRTSIIQLRFSFIDGPRKSLSSTSVNDERAAKLGVDNQRLQILLRQAEELEKRRMGEIQGLETKLEAMGCLLRTLAEQRTNLEDKLKEIKRSASSGLSSVSVWNNVNNNHTGASTTSTPLGGMRFSTGGDVLDGSKLILSGVIQLASHALVDYAKSPTLVRRHFGQLISAARNQSINPYCRLRGIVSDSVLHRTLDYESANPYATESSTSVVPLTNAVSLPLEHILSRTSSQTSGCFLVENVDSGCQTDFWYDSEWDEDMYEVDWGPDDSS